MHFFLPHGLNLPPGARQLRDRLAAARPMKSISAECFVAQSFADLFSGMETRQIVMALLRKHRVLVWKAN